MDSTAGGFFFSFDPPSAEGGGLGSAVAGTGQTAAGAAHGVVSWPPATTSTAAFPWVPLDADTLQSWAAAYCGGGGSGASQAGVSTQRGGRTPKPLQLRLHAASAPALTLCYQTPPEVDTLTSVVAAADAAPSDSAPREHRDVIPGRYYGGLKVWSCAVLLAQYLAEHAVVYRDMLAAAAVVVELGCGQGLPGMAAMCLGARRVAFQDFNAEVLDVCTKPNVAATMLANADARGGSSGGDGDGVATAPAPQAKFIHGDWVELAWEAVDGAACDVILGADVTFDKEACDKLACVLQRWLRPRTGVALLASKDYYFGTSGGHLEFTKSAEPHGLRVELLTRVDTADKMPHVVLRVTHAS
ncbi:putative methyltransferase [Novymonas esmeraldas]|uniref:protein-histidine N-methyltransferase n=1 Tax=Novymonas esmeraldas TaxID=1808958 RepID=A0AAW0EQU5_9TRYP